MGLRLSRGGLWSALLGLVAFAAVIVRMDGLVRPSDQPPSWQVVLVGAFALGAALALVGRFLRLRGAGTAALALLVTAVLLGRVAAPETMVAGLIPTLDTWDAVAASLAEGLEFLRFGTAPIFPHQQLLLLLLPAFLAVGAGWGGLAASGRGALAATVPGGLYLAVAIADQSASELAWILGGVVWVAAVLVVSGWEETVSLPRLLGRPGRAGAMAAGVLVVVLGLVVTDISAGAVPGSGTVPWRDTTGIGGLRSGVSLNLFTSTVQTNLVSDSEEMVFRAAVSGSPVPLERLYWSLITLDSYDGRNWSPTWSETRPVDGDTFFERPDHRFLGPTATVFATVEIGALRQGILPTLYSVREVSGDSPLLRNGVRARDDGALVLDGRTRDGLVYELVSEVPSADLRTAALGADGDLPPLFDAAVEAGAFSLEDGSGTGVARRPADLERFTELPESLDPAIGNLAADLTAGADHPLEQMALLEVYFREAGGFTYTTDIDPGHAAQDLSAWLLDEESPNYHAGYCEQFATALGVMGRSLDIPTRVVLGFTPGTLNEFGEVVVRGRNAHAWVEAWIDGVGWVRFDPTPRGEGDNPATTAELGFNLAEFIDEEEQNPLTGFNPGGGPILADRDFLDQEFLEGEVPTPGALDGEGVPITDDGVQIPGRVWWWLAIGLAIAAIPVTKLVRRRRRLAKARDGDVSSAWAEITDQLRDLDRRVTASMTPDEIATATGPELAPLAAAHARAVWGSTPPGPAERERALESYEATASSLRRATPPSKRAKAVWNPKSLWR